MWLDAVEYWYWPRKKACSSSIVNCHAGMLTKAVGGMCERRNFAGVYVVVIKEVAHGGPGWMAWVRRFGAAVATVWVNGQRVGAWVVGVARGERDCLITKKRTGGEGGGGLLFISIWGGLVVAFGCRL